MRQQLLKIAICGLYGLASAAVAQTAPQVAAPSLNTARSRWVGR